MFCSSSNNSGFIKIEGPIKSVDINEIDNYPLSISFSAKSTIPKLNKNTISEDNSNTCIYNNTQFNLVNIQICKLVHEGYIFPENGSGPTPKLELILSFSARSIEKNLYGVLLCIPIYNNGNTTGGHADYLNQIIDNKDDKIYTLDSIFYGQKNDEVQKSIAYKTCFESINKDKPVSKELYIVVFPNGIKLTPARYVKLEQMIKYNNEIPTYFIHPNIRESSTLFSYKTNGNGDKYDTEFSSEGKIYTNSISSCDPQFKTNFVFYKKPPYSKRINGTSEQCPYYKTSEYKCVPFNKSRDLSDNLVIPGKKTLETIISEQNSAKTNSKSQSINSVSTDQIVGIVAGIGAAVVLCIIGLKIGSAVSNSN